MNSKESTPTLQERIMEKIQDRELTMRSRLFFVAKVVATAVLAVIVLVLSIFLVSFLFFILRVNGHESLLALGTRGINIFIHVFPWWLLIIDVALLFILENIVRKFKFGYRSPVLYLFFALVVLAAGVGIALDRGTSVNDGLLRSADQGHLPPPFNTFYKGARRPPPLQGAYRGTVERVLEQSFMLSDPDRTEDALLVILPNTHPTPPLSVGDVVFVIGDEKDGVIHAIDVRLIDPDAIAPGQRFVPVRP